MSCYVLMRMSEEDQADPIIDTLLILGMQHPESSGPGGHPSPYKRTSLGS